MSARGKISATAGKTQAGQSARHVASRPAPAGMSRPDHLMALHGAMGNRAVRGLLDAGPGAAGPLDPAVRTFFEPRFNRDFSRVRVHTGASAAASAARLGANAYTTGNNIYFAAGRYQPHTTEGKRLLAHELTHVAQGATGTHASPASFPIVSRPTDPAERQADATADAVMRGASVTVPAIAAVPGVVYREVAAPRSGLFGFDPLSFIAEKANLIPGFRMFTIVLGVNPINMSSVDRSPANILRAVVEFIPGGGLITQALDNYGIFNKVGIWVEKQIRTLGLAAGSIKRAITDFIGTLKLSDIVNPGGVWERARRIFTEPIERIKNFVKGLAADIIQFIKDAILMPLARLAEGTRGWGLLIAVLGKNPITGEVVPRTAETLIGGFMKLIGQEEVWENMKKAKAVDRAWTWFQKALETARGFVQQIPALFMAALRSLELVDIVLVPRAFVKVATVFGNFLGNFIRWAGNAVWNLLEIIFDVVSPGAFTYIKRTGAALKSILKNPIPFVGNLVKAAKLGFQNFAGNFLTHLKAGLIDWLTGSLPGVYIPKAFSLGEIVKFVFSVLGLTWQNVRVKLVKVIGEPAVKAMETGFDIVVTLVREGPAAAWDKIKEHLANLKDMVIGGITDFVVDTVVKKAVPKLVAMFIPGAGFISAIISIYDTIMVFVEKIKKIVQVVKAFVDSIVQIAAGAIGAAATRVETTLAGMLSLAISFFAGFVGLGKVSDKIMGVIQKIRAPVDKALDALIKWIVTMAKKGFAKVFGKKDEPMSPEVKKRWDAGMKEIETLQKKAEKDPEDEDEIKKHLAPIKTKYGFKKLEAKIEGDEWVVDARMNPSNKPRIKATPRDEGKAGHHGDLPKARGKFEAHHIPQSALMKFVVQSIAGFKHAAWTKLKGWTHGKGVAIVMSKERHKNTRTWGGWNTAKAILKEGKETVDEKAALVREKSAHTGIVGVIKEEMAADKKDVKKIYGGADKDLAGRVDVGLGQVEVMNNAEYMS